MPFLSCPDMAEAVIHASIDGVNIANVLHFKFNTPYTQTDIDNLAALVDARVGSDYLPITNDDVSYTETTVRGLTSIADLAGAANANAGLGADASASLPANSTFCVTGRSSLTGRSQRGRFYAFPIGVAALSAVNTVSGAYIADIVGFLMGVKSDAAAAGWTNVVLSRRTGGAPRLVGVGTPIAAWVARNAILDSQRGRLPQGH